MPPGTLHASTLCRMSERRAQDISTMNNTACSWRAVLGLTALVLRMTASATGLALNRKLEPV